MPWCDRCERSFSSYRALEQHRSSSSRHNICNSCGLDFSQERGLVQHYVQSRSHHYCQRCEEHFGDNDDLVQHYHYAHYYCDTCEKVFSSDLGLHGHNRQSHWYCIPCKRVFRSESNLDNHHKSSIHQPKKYPCPGRGCGMSFVSESARVLHFEAGTCPSGVNRNRLNKFAIQMDRSNIITNSSRLISGSSSSNSSTQIWATQRNWNGYAYECSLCHRDFRAIGALNTHLQSPAHEGKIYRCPTAWRGCNTQFKTLSALFQHVESESCGVHRFQKNLQNAIGSLTDGMRRIGL